MAVPGANARDKYDLYSGVLFARQGVVLSSDKKKHKRKVKTHWAKKRRKASRALRRRGR